MGDTHYSSAREHDAQKEAKERAERHNAELKRKQKQCSHPDELTIMTKVGWKCTICNLYLDEKE